MKKEMNKKAQDLSIGTLILIVLGIVVLVLLILGFSMGWSNLWEKINIFGGGSSVGDIATSCTIAVTQANQYAYCQDFKKVKSGSTIEYLNCEDTRIQPSLTTKLTCTKPEGYTNWREWYCNKSISDDDRSKGIKVNGAACPTMTAEELQKAQETEAYKTACTNAQGNIINGAACPTGQVAATLTETKPEGKICCKTDERS
jgi:hypothetical protein